MPVISTATCTAGNCNPNSKGALAPTNLARGGRMVYSEPNWAMRAPHPTGRPPLFALAPSLLPCQSSLSTVPLHCSNH